MNPSPNEPRRGLLAGGNWIIDHVKILDGWPPQDALANILDESWANGGAPYNVLKDLSKLGAPFPLEGIGLIGEDADGDKIIADCQAHHIDIRQLRRTRESATSYSDVMTDSATGRRTFFYRRGANALLAPEHFDFSESQAKLFHLGYLLLLDNLDRMVDGRPLACQVFERAAQAGLRTSLDCVSENSDRLRAVMQPVLPCVDTLFLNDYEAEKLTGRSLRRPSDGALIRTRVEEAATALLEMGARGWALVHFPEGAYARSAQQRSGIWQPSLAMPPGAIKGAAGAGDAFAAGVLYGLHEDMPMEEALRIGVCVAASSLFDTTCSHGVLPLADCLRLADKHAWQRIPD